MTEKTRKYYPKKYYAGLSNTQKAKRYREIQKFKKISWRSARAYKGFKTDKNVKNHADMSANRQLGDPKPRQLEEHSASAAVVRAARSTRPPPPAGLALRFCFALSVSRLTSNARIS
jgi:hypothetical protein